MTGAGSTLGAPGRAHHRRVRSLTAFNLLQNLRERIEQRLSRGRLAEPLASKKADAEAALPAPAVLCGPPGEPALAVHHDLVKQTRRDVRRAMFDRVRSLRDAGNSLIDIIRKTGLD